MSQPQETVVPKKPVYRSIRLSAAAMGAKEVIVTGDFTGWAKAGVRMSPKGPGLWETTLQLAPGQYEYRLLIDGQWRDHSEALKRVPNPYGSQNCVLLVP